MEIEQFLLFAIINYAAVNVCVQVLARAYDFISLGYVLGVGHAVLRVSHFSLQWIMCVEVWLASWPSLPLSLTFSPISYPLSRILKYKKLQWLSVTYGRKWNSFTWHWELFSV